MRQRCVDALLIDAAAAKSRRASDGARYASATAAMYAMVEQVRREEGDAKSSRLRAEARGEEGAAGVSRRGGSGAS